MKRKLVVILGPTASGKSSLAVAIAKKYRGEIVSADSRQVYKRMNIGTGKVTPRETKGVPHHLLDVASPKRTFTVSDYQRMARKKIEKILKMDKLPILCGGTGLYLRAIVDGLVIPEVAPNPTLRKKLEKLPTAKLYTMLRSLDRRRAAQIDRKNPRRLIRAIEIAKQLGRVPPLQFAPFEGKVLIIGVKKTRAELSRLIRVRLLKRFGMGMIEEVRALHAEGVSWKKLESFGLEYRNIAHFLRGTITKSELFSKLEHDINQYAKRQMTWFGRDERVCWITKKGEALRLASRFLGHNRNDR